MSAGDGVKTRFVDSRRLVSRQYLKSSPQLQDCAERLRGSHEAAGVQSRHERGVLSANDTGHDLDDHGVAWFEKAFCPLHDGEPLLEGPEKRAELREVRNSEYVELLECSPLVAVVEVSRKETQQLLVGGRPGVVDVQFPTQLDEEVVNEAG